MAILLITVIGASIRCVVLSLLLVVTTSCREFVFIIAKKQNQNKKIKKTNRHVPIGIYLFVWVWLFFITNQVFLEQ